MKKAGQEKIYLRLTGPRQRFLASPARLSADGGDGDYHNDAAGDVLLHLATTTVYAFIRSLHPI